MVGQYFAGIQGDRTVEWRFFFHTDIILDNSSLEDCQIFGEQETTDFGCRITHPLGVGNIMGSILGPSCVMIWLEDC